MAVSQRFRGFFFVTLMPALKHFEAKGINTAVPERMRVSTAPHTEHRDGPLIGEPRPAGGPAGPRACEDRTVVHADFNDFFTAAPGWPGH